MYRIVLDTNIFVSGGTISIGAPSQIINHWRNQDFVMVVSPQLVAEYEEVLSRPRVAKFTGLTPQENFEYIHEVMDRAYITSGILKLDVLIQDPDDNIVLACAEEGMATHLVT
ncbi:MAG: putative toxin-antitoxin system toxin component, PIN family [Candidatus Levyibacteriota bacterium]